MFLIRNFYKQTAKFDNNWFPKCELPKVIIRHNIGPISAAKSRPLLLGQCHCLHRSSAGPSTAAFFDYLNLPTFSRNLAQYRPYTKPIVIFTMTSSSESRRARDGLIIGTALARCCAENKCWRPEFGPALAAKCIPELSFQQRHDIGSRFSANFWRCWASAGPYLISHFGHSKNCNFWFLKNPKRQDLIKTLKHINLPVSLNSKLRLKMKHINLVKN